MESVSDAEFSLLVAEALDALPDWVHAKLDNIAVVSADWPTVEQQRRSGIPPNHYLLGLYEGVPATRRGRGYTMLPPDRVTLFRIPMLRIAQNKAELIKLVQRTLLHELGHHFGFDELDLRKLDI